MTDSTAAVLPEPDSPTMPTVSPARTKIDAIDGRIVGVTACEMRFQTHQFDDCIAHARGNTFAALHGRRRCRSRQSA